MSRLGGVGLRRRDAAVIATEGIVAAGMQLVSAVCRHYWPASLIGAIVSKRCRRVLIVAALADGVADWMSRARTVENASEHIETLWFRWRLGLLDFDQGLVGPFRSVEDGFELCGR